MIFVLAESFLVADAQQGLSCRVDQLDPALGVDGDYCAPHVLQEGR